MENEQDHALSYYAEQAAAATGVSTDSIYRALESVVAYQPVGPKQYEALKIMGLLMKTPTRPLYRDVPMNRAGRRRKKR